MTARSATLAELIAASDERPPQPLGDLAARLGVAVSPDGGVRLVRGVAFDSRAVRPGNVFVAITGERSDGHAFVGAAAEAGAVAAVVERPVDAPIPQLIVQGSRRALAETACWWYGDPSAELGVVGITGTDGKTTTSYLATAALEAAGIPSGMLGTAALEIGDMREPNPEHATTPEAPQLQAILRAMVTAGDRAAVVETTSHALALDRVAGVRYDIAILTNVTSEHLELHGTWEAYRDAKRSLFDGLTVGPDNPPKPDPGWPRTGIVNANDDSHDAFIETAGRAGARVVTYSANPSRRPADVAATNVVVGRLGAGLRLWYSTPSGDGALRSPLTGTFNIDNLLAVIALGEALGLDPRAVRAGLESVAAVPGRMERIVAGQPFEVVVDFAHTAASLRGALAELQNHARLTGGGLLVVFGSAGERDTEKRPDMGEAAGTMASLVVLTDEDPRGEDGEAILAEIAVGAEAAGKRRGIDLLLIPDRRTAIRAAFERARPGDVVLLAGKGHERTIEYADRTEPWSEAAEARAALRELGFDAAE
ncbi:MAG: UDP-N-acetylmuramoyl-L-alanyl-D-glutamate--2,6-diaminopimelate ligase [Chloroflexi bacterium]|nr:UDP-N-acetylmuramoyl-L-alanyl-D-glutamate--2,6-diaminopimelate ligase [Chloroflexota bacterium]